MHLNKVLVLGCSRSGTTEFCKTLQDISSKKFVWEPEFNHSEKIIEALGVTDIFRQNIQQQKYIWYQVWCLSTKKIHRTIIEYSRYCFFLIKKKCFSTSIIIKSGKENREVESSRFWGRNILTKRKR